MGIIQIINLFNKLKLLVYSQVSSNYKTISKERAGSKHLLEGWKDESIPEKQWLIVELELKRYRETGIGTKAYHAAIDMVKDTNLKSSSLLDVGCSSGYYSEIFKIAGVSIKYTGCDYSKSFIKMAKEKYPSVDFYVSNATKLDFNNHSFDIVLLGGVLVHLKDWGKAIKEATRVSKGIIILHRMPMIHIAPTHYYQRRGYGVDMIEVTFNEEELFKCLYDLGLAVIGSKSYYPRFAKDLKEQVIDKTYLVQKISAVR